MSNELLERVKASEQDFEWYPTTRGMLEVVASDILKETDEFSCTEKTREFSILDIGAGNGNALNTICELTKNVGEKYAIEKSRVLVESLDKDTFIIGTDFQQQTLIDKKVDVIFCNPPYSDYENWMRRIVTEANCRLIYLVVPQRWKENKNIVHMIDRRIGKVEGETTELGMRWRNENSRYNGSCEVLASDTFEDSEFRKARANIDIVKIKIRVVNDYRNEPELDPFDIWYEEYFKIVADKETKTKYEEEKSQKDRLHDLVKGYNLIERLDNLYQADMTALMENYKSLEKLDTSLLKELGVDVGQIKGGLQQKIAGLKNLYWNELFENLESLTDRLTTKYRKLLLSRLTSHVEIDFTANNAYAIILWAIKNSNVYFDDQLKDVYYRLSDQENIRNYKSNKRILTDNFRYCKNEVSHYTLDYRLVIDRIHCFGGYGWELERGNGLSETGHELLKDICTIAKNLGFDILSKSMDFQWSAGKKNEFLYSDGKLFMDVKAYQKGTMHIRLDQNFMRKLNVEAARLNGWVKSPEEAVQETGIDEAVYLYGSNYKVKTIKLIEG